MPNVAGYAIEIIGSGIGSLRPSWFAAPVTFNEFDGWLINIPILAGGRTNTQPVDEQEIDRTGYGAFNAGYGAIWYNRIQITPSVIDVGNLITDKSTVVEVWNGYLTSKNFESLSYVNAEGIGITTPIPIPSTVSPLVANYYTVTVTTEGPSSIDASYVWTVDGVSYSLAILGNRIIVFPFAPNWSSPATESLAWLTTVERSYSGDEQRTRWRDAARRDMEFEVTISDYHEAARLENMMFGWQSRSWAVPIITDRATLTAPGNIGTASLNLNTTNLGFYAGMPAILISDSETYEAIEITAVTSTSLTLARGLANSWPAGTPIYPAGVGQMSASQPLTRLSDYYLQGSFAWRFAVGDQTANTPAGTAAVTYQGQEVFLTKPNWADTPTFTFQDAYETFGDASSGLLEFDQTSDWPTILRRARYDFTTRSAIVDFRKFLARRAGRWAPCWLPSWNDDFRIVENANSNASVLRVTDNNYRGFVEGHAARRNIAIFRYSTANPLIVQIVSTEQNGDGTINLVLTASIGTSITVSDIKRVCHINLFRLASDQVTLTWETPNVATAILTWQLVKE